MKSLVILAAGMGSRFGGLKQVAPLGPNGEFIIDYSIHDAISAGFEKVIFIIKEENYEIFKSTIGSRVEDKIKVCYAFQKNDIDLFKNRVKPLGTAHAIMAARPYIDGPFMIINADDYYGVDAFIKGSNFLDNMESNTYGLVGYRAINTISSNGSVKRGICESKDGYLTNIVESKLEMIDNNLYATPLSGGDTIKIDNNSLVSMNMLLFDETLFKYLDEDIKEFIANVKDINNDEFLIPDVICKHMNNKDILVKVIDTTSTWYGVTYKEDSDYVKKSLKELHDTLYGKSLW